MQQILFLLPDDTMTEYVRDLLSDQIETIQVIKGYATDAIPLAKDFLGKGGEVVIARSGTAALIRQELNINVVDVPITGFDIIRAVQEARHYGKRIAVVTLNSATEGIEYLAPILDVELCKFPFVAGVDEAIAASEEAIKAGVDVIIGGVAAIQAAKKHGTPAVLLKNTRESILLAVREANYVLHALRLEKAKRNTLNTMLGYAYEGIIVVDQDQTVTEFNPAAEQFTHIGRSSALNRKIDAILPQLQLGQIIKTGHEDLHTLLKFHDITVMCNKVPILLGNTVIGAVATMQDITKIQAMEAQIRQELYTKGHIAKYSFDNIIGTSGVITDTVHKAKQFAKTESNILIIGETGTGKEVFAQSIHNFSNRFAGPFIAVNCAALPTQLLESELFGYVAGAFTGAVKTGKMGLFEVAHRGTIFLDEISEMDYINQGRLLRVLQEKSVVRLGSDKVIPVDVRIVAATNKDLKQRVADGKFRDDLYFRLNVLRLILPPLRLRGTDIEEFAQLFLKIFAGKANRKIRISTDGLNYLTQYPWPGNIRELQNTMERVVAICPGEVIDHDLLVQSCDDEYAFSAKPNEKHQVEIQRIQDALERTNGKLAETSKILGMDRTTLWRRMKKLGIKKIE